MRQGQFYDKHVKHELIDIHILYFSMEISFVSKPHNQFETCWKSQRGKTSNEAHSDSKYKVLKIYFKTILTFQVSLGLHGSVSGENWQRS